MASLGTIMQLSSTCRDTMLFYTPNVGKSIFKKWNIVNTLPLYTYYDMIYFLIKYRFHSKREIQYFKSMRNNIIKSMELMGTDNNKADIIYYLLRLMGYDNDTIVYIALSTRYLGLLAYTLNSGGIVRRINNHLAKSIKVISRDDYIYEKYYISALLDKTSIFKTVGEFLKHNRLLGDLGSKKFKVNTWAYVSICQYLIKLILT